MKRSKMVDIIADQFVLRGMCSKEMSRHAANEILEVIEKQGIFPPTVTYIENGEYCFMNIWKREDIED